MNNSYADERQANLYKKFPTNHFLGNEKNLHHVFLWNTYFRRNLHQVALMYLGIDLHLYQIIILYLMGISKFFVIIACRAAAKSFIIALYACCICIVKPYTKVVLSSATRGQSKLIVSEKISNELMRMSPMLQKEVKNIKNNQNEVIVYFRNNSTITVVTANENGRGYRANCIIREEFRQINKKVDDSILSPFQIIRQTPYIKDPYYNKLPDAESAPIDIYISSSWVSPHWMWDIVDTAYKDMLNDKDSCLLAFDESITLKHRIKPMETLVAEKKKQDPLTWAVEFENARLSENTHAFFTHKSLLDVQNLKKPFYPRSTIDILQRKKNIHDIKKQPGEIRVVSCDMAFVENKKNDNSIFSCVRLIPESTTYGENNNVEVMQGYRNVVCYITSTQGGETTKQALEIRRLFEEFKADYIVLDTRNAGISIYDLLAKTMFDEERNVEYSPLTCMNNENLANRVKIVGAKPCIFAISASEKMNSDIALNMRTMLGEKKINLLVNFNTALEEVLPNISEYVSTPYAEVQAFYEAPFLETQELISEMVNLTYEKKAQTGVIKISERSTERKDRYTSVSYCAYFSSLLSLDLLSSSGEYEFEIFVN